MSEILKPTPEQLAAILADHTRWLRGEGGKKANLQFADLQFADLRSANLQFADLQFADLRSADLQSANLQFADLRSANLQFADLQSANLRSADLRSANLQSADLQFANLQSANLQSANLQSADLQSANLQSADLQSANNAQLAFSLTEILPREGEVIGWKKCRDGVLVKLRIPPEAKRSNATGRKCRGEFADPLEVIGAEFGLSMRACATEYRVGIRVHCHEWSPDRWIECAGGVHFFLTREEAEAWTG